MKVTFIKHTHWVWVVIIGCLLFFSNLQACAWKSDEPVNYRIKLVIPEFCPSENSELNKLCNARGSLVTRHFWNHYTGALCYSYTNKIRFNIKYNITIGTFICNNETYRIPITIINETYFWYDYTNETSTKYVKKSFGTNDYFEMWMSCCEEAAYCCDNFMTDSNIYPNEKFACPAIWDAWTCFPPTPANSVQHMPCSKQAYSTNSAVCVLNSEKQCFPNGTWNQNTNYESCAIAPVLRSRHNFHVVCLSVAIFLILPAAILLSAFRNFRKSLRLSLHRNLIIVMILRCILTIISKEIIILDALKTTDSNSVMNNNSIACRVLAFFENVAKNAIYACMLVDGFYLHKLIVRVFAKEPELIYLYTVVIVFSFLPSFIWAILRGCKGATSCWMVDNDGDQWIVDGFRIAILAINVIFLIDIIRVMVTKLKHNTTTRHTMATFRATLFLIPLFGINIIIFANRNIISGDSCYAEDVYYYASYFMEGFQGVMVALLFCYCSGEVQNELKNAHRKLMVYLQQNYNFNFGKDHLNRRRTTAATYVGANGIE